MTNDYVTHMPRLRLHLFGRSTHTVTLDIFRAATQNMVCGSPTLRWDHMHTVRHVREAKRALNLI